MDKKAVILAGIVVGLVGAGLAWLGNPPNMGLCVVCFTRDAAGALGLHRVSTVQYLRPEIMGFLLGSCLAAAFGREWRARGGSSPVLRFFLGMAVAIGALIFLGCPLRMVLRLAGGDLTALY
ncbi:MAG: YedE-related selenium metabolism membrane protein, partial [Bacillota bacterium]